MQRDTSAKSEPDQLFSPSSEKPRSSMTAERDKNSVLFKLDDVASEAKGIPQPVAEESSGLVEIQSVLAAEAAESSPGAAPSERDSSGLVDLNKLLADAEAAKEAKAEGPAVPVVPVVPVVPALAPTALVEDQPAEVAAAGPAIPTWMLVGVIVALAATVGVLVLKLT